MLTPEEKLKIIKEFRTHPEDTGSLEVQIGLLTEEIKRLVSHLKCHRKDFHSKRGLLKMVAKRRKFLNQLKKENPRKYHQILNKLGLKK